MSKVAFYFCMFIGILVLGITTVEIVLEIRFSTQTYALPSFRSWFTFIFVLYLFWLLSLLVYHFKENQKAAFMAGSLLALAWLCRYYITFKTVFEGELKDLYFASYLVVLVTTLLYAVILTFSETRQLPWLKKAGMLSSLITVLLLLTFIGYLNVKDLDQKTIFENVHNKVSWANALFILLVVIHFKSQVRNSRNDIIVRRSQEILQATLLIVGMATLSYSFILSKKLLNETPSNTFREGLATKTDVAYAERFEPRIFINAQKDTLLYRLLKPMKYDAKQQYPLVVCLHGGAGWGTDNIKQVKGSLPAVMLSNYLAREKYPAFLFVPQISGKYSWGGIPNLKPADSLLLGAIRALEKEFSIDAKRRYLSGNSLGGFGTWYFIGKYPEMFAAAIPISGSGDPSFAKNMVDVPIWAFHGKKDINVPVSGSRDMITAIRKAGGHPKYHEYADADHDIWKKVENTPNLLDWMFEQKRK